MKTPFVTKDQLEAICQQYPTPFHLYDEAGIRENARAGSEPGVCLESQAFGNISPSRPHPPPASSRC